MGRVETPAALTLGAAFALLMMSGCDSTRTPPLVSIPGPGPEAVATANPPAPAEPPGPFAPAGAGFRVAMPGDPKERAESTALPDGGTMTARVYSSRDPGTRLEYMVSFSEFSPGAIGSLGTPDEALANGAQGLVVPLRAEIKGQAKVALDGHPGREIRLETNPEKDRAPWRGLARVYLVGDRFYQVCAFGPADGYPAAQAEAFVRSFALDGSR